MLRSASIKSARTRACAVLLGTLVGLCACDSAADRKAREEAMIAAGSQQPGNSAAIATGDKTAAVQPSPTEVAQTREAQATMPSDDDGILLGPTPGPPFSPKLSSISPLPLPDVIGRPYLPSDFECHPDSHPDFCARGAESLAAEANELRDELLQSCMAVHGDVVEAKAALKAQAGNLEADLNGLSEKIRNGQKWLSGKCY